MSYCVNCGVELAPSEQHCPLCGIEVINPQDPWKEPKIRPFPAYFETVVRRVNRRYLCSIIALLLTIPVIICLLTDLLHNGGISWSAYVAGAILLIMVAVLLPLVLLRARLFLFLAADMLAVLAYLWLIAIITGGSWFRPVALPITLVCALCATFIIAYFRYRREKGMLLVMAVLLFNAGGLTMLIEIIIKSYLGRNLLPNWSWYALVPCILCGLVFLVLHKQIKWREKIRKRLFF